MQSSLPATPVGHALTQQCMDGRAISAAGGIVQRNLEVWKCGGKPQGVSLRVRLHATNIQAPLLGEHRRGWRGPVAVATHPNC